MRLARLLNASAAAVESLLVLICEILLCIRIIKNQDKSVLVAS